MTNLSEALLTNRQEISVNKFDRTLFDFVVFFCLLAGNDRILGMVFDLMLLFLVFLNDERIFLWMIIFHQE